MAIPSTLLFLIVSTLIAAGAAVHGTGSNSLRDACRVTRHRSLCIHSLASYSHHRSRHSPQTWARAAVSVTIAESERVYNYLLTVKTDGRRAKIGLSDCRECFGDAVDQLHGGLVELRRLERSTFEYQMSNVETSLSAALTNQDTCLDGLRKLKGSQMGTVRSKVLNTTYYTSNALALVNKLASSGGK